MQSKIIESFSPSEKTKKKTKLEIVEVSFILGLDHKHKMGSAVSPPTT